MLEEGRIDRRRHHRRDGDGNAVVLELHSERIQHAVDAMFGRGIGRVVRQRDLALHGRDGDERSAAMSLHDRHRRQRGERLPRQSDIDDALELVRSRRFERRVHRDGGRLHPRVEPAELAFGRQRHRLDLRELGGVGRDGQCLAAELSESPRPARPAIQRSGPTRRRSPQPSQRSWPSVGRCPSTRPSQRPPDPSAVCRACWQSASRPADRQRRRSRFRREAPTAAATEKRALERSGGGSRAARRRARLRPATRRRERRRRSPVAPVKCRGRGPRTRWLRSARPARPAWGRASGTPPPRCAPGRVVQRSR